MSLYLGFDKSLKKPIYEQLYEYLVKEIIAGRLEENKKMPSIRELSRQLNISRNTVETAYQQLTAEGYISSRPKSGFYVNVIENNSCFAVSPVFSSISMEEESTPAIVQYSFSSDFIDQESFNFPTWNKFINKALKNTRRYLTYGSHQGEYALRSEIARYLQQSRGVVCTPEQVIVGAGVQSLLHILCFLLKKVDTTVAFEDPGFKKGQYIFSDHNFRIIAIALENNAININQLAKSGAKMVYVNPSHQVPMGSTMPINVRLQLLKWAHENNSFIIEDDYDSELRYFGKPLPSLQGLNNGKNVVYLSSFSKILLPSLRISYMVLPPDLLASYEANKHRYNQTSSTIEQIALAQFIKEGHLEKHIRRLRKIYARKNQLIIEALTRIMKQRVTIRGKETGLHLLLEIKTGLTTKQLVEAAEKVGVQVTPVTQYYIENTDTSFPQIIISYGGIPKEHITTAIELLNSAWF